MKNRMNAASILGGIIVYGILIVVFVVTFVPFWQVFVLSINDYSKGLHSGIVLWPNGINLDSYITVLNNGEILNALIITTLRVAIGVPINVLFTSLLAYTLSKDDLVGKRIINLFFVITMYFSGGMIPSYMIIRSVGLIDHFPVFIIPGMINVFWMILIRTYMQGLPDEIEEAAEIEGANEIQIFRMIIIPICTPVLATVVLFSSISHWNSWYDSYIYTYKPSLRTLQAILVKILNQYQMGEMLSFSQQLANQSKRVPVTSESIRMTVTMVSTVPIILVYPLIQKYFIKGILIGAIKT